MKVSIASEVDNGRRKVRFSSSAVDYDEGMVGKAITLTVGGEPIAVFSISEAKGTSGNTTHFQSVEVDISTLLTLTEMRVDAIDAYGRPLEPDVPVRFEGDVFRALALDTPDEFHKLIQLHHSRFTSPVLLELGAWAAVLRFPDDFVVRNAALVVMAHRILERPFAQLQPADFARAQTIVQMALEDIVLGEDLIREGGDTPDWRYIRWTISLATVAGYLALLNNRYTDAATLFAVNVRQVPNVHFAKVSALNLVLGCFTHGLLMSAFGMRDAARDSFSTGLEAVKPVVQAQNLFENVWVIGDLMNVMVAARQCFIALVRLNLRSFDPSQPIIDPGQQIDTALLKGPLRAILNAGWAPLLADHLTACGGR
ncbi:MAG: hypothetical protein EON47_00175 [Acetobacteraceae bacterium]|nr:MAG: hypothetical protein EON47_00175 [Acetobacteraceae bacterium]